MADVWVVWLVAFTTHGQGIGGSPTVMIAPKLPSAPTPVITPWAGSQLRVPLRPALPHTSMYTRSEPDHPSPRTVTFWPALAPVASRVIVGGPSSWAPTARGATRTEAATTSAAASEQPAGRHALTFSRVGAGPGVSPSATWRFRQRRQPRNPARSTATRSTNSQGTAQ